MPQNDFSIRSEAIAAARGVLALLVGDRGAARFFDFSQRGLVGSFLALLAVFGVTLLVQLALGAAAGGGGGIAKLVIQNVLIYAGIIGAPIVLLRSLGRMDAVRPYLVTLNWANSVFSVVLLVMLFVAPALVLIAGVICGLAVLINSARIVMTLKVSQIVLLVIAQIVGFLAALLLIVFIFPLSPEQLAAIAAASSPPS